VTAIKHLRVAELLAGETGRGGDYLPPGGERRPDPRRRVFDGQALPRPDPELSGYQEVHLGVGFPMLDIFAGDDHVELVRQSKDAEHAPGVFAVGLGGQGRRKPLSPDAAEQGYAARIGVLLDQFRVAEHLLVDAEPDPDVCLPRPVHPKLRHTRPGRVLKPEAAHQVDGDLLARETHQASEARDHFSFGEAGAQLGGGAGVGEL
jgi:hypothetical protein